MWGWRRGRKLVFRRSAAGQEPPTGADRGVQRVRRTAQRVTMVPVAAYRQPRSRGVEVVDGATVSVAVVSSRTEAELIAGVLRSHGLRAAVSADDAGGQYPQMQ